MKRSIAMLLLLGACKPDVGLVDARFTDRGEARREVLPILGLYYGELEIVMYDYRPGEAVQYDPNWGSGTDFSYWIPLQSGHDAARDNVLRAGDTLDLPTLNAEYAQEPPSGDFVQEVGAFDADLVEVHINGSGLVSADGFFGDNPVDQSGVPTNGYGDDVPLYKYDDLADLPGYWSTMTFPGWSSEGARGAISLVFARSDWFPDPVMVYLNAQTGPYAVAWSNAPLDAEQTEVLEAMANQGTMRRGYDRLIVVPYDATRIVFDEGKAADLPAFSHEVAAADAKITVSFDLSEALSASSDLYADDVDRFDSLQPQVFWSGDENHVPFGVGMVFGDLPATCSNTTMDGDETGVDCGGSCGGCVDPEIPTDCAGDAPPSGLALNRFRGAFRGGFLDDAGIGIDFGERGEPFEGWIALDPALVDSDADAAIGTYALADASDGLMVLRTATTGWCVEATVGSVSVHDRAGGDNPGAGDAFEVELSTLAPMPSAATSVEIEFVLGTPEGDRLTSDDLPVELLQASSWDLPNVSLRFHGAASAETVLFGDLFTIYQSPVD